MHKNLLYKFYFIEKFKKSNIDLLQRNTNIIYRNYKKKYKVDEILLIKNYCRRRGLNFFLSNNIKLAIKLDLDGAYIPSFNTDMGHLSYNFKQKFDLIGSAHNLKQIRIKEKQNAKLIFISSIFKKNNNYLGINKFRIVSSYTKKEVIVLGGVSKQNIRLINLTEANGFAGISFFETKKRPHKGASF